VGNADNSRFYTLAGTEGPSFFLAPVTCKSKTIRCDGSIYGATWWFV